MCRRARARLTASRVFDYRLSTSRALNAEIDTLVRTATRVESRACVENVMQDMKPFAKKVRASAQAILDAAKAAPRRLERLRSLVDAAQTDVSRKRKRAATDEDDRDNHRDPADLVAAHLAQPESLNDFISPPTLGRESRTVKLLDKQICM